MSLQAVASSTPNTPRPGRLTYTVSQFWAEYERATPSHRRAMLGLSPGGAASLLRISRQSVHRAIDRGTLDAYYVYEDKSGDLAWITISMDSIADYFRRNRQ